MERFLRLDPILYLHTPLGVAEAHFVHYAGGDVHKVWGTFQVETKENWWWPNPWVRLCESATALRDVQHSAIYLNDAELETLGRHILRHKLSPLYARAAQYLRGEV